MKSIYSIEYKKDLVLDLHLPENECFDLFVYFHGGGLEKGSRGGVEDFVQMALAGEYQPFRRDENGIEAL